MKDHTQSKTKQTVYDEIIQWLQRLLGVTPTQQSLAKLNHLNHFNKN